jgi:Rieske Fe-S protein
MTITRRELLKCGAASGLVVLVGAPACAVGAPPVYDAVVSDDPTELDTYGTVQVALDAVPDLAFAGGAVCLRLAPLGDPTRQRPFQLPSPPELLVVHRSRGDGAAAWIAVDSACPHQGCPLGYAPDVDQIACPCHSSRFRAAPTNGDPGTCTGQVLHGPARQGPKAYAVTLDAATRTLAIQLGTAVGCGAATLPAVSGGTLTLAIADFPLLANPGGAVIGTPAGLTHAIAIVRVDGGATAASVSAVDATCTHLGCTVAWSDGGGDACGAGPAGFECPCHCSRFDSHGALVNGPATRPLSAYPVTFDGQTLVVTVG